MKHIAILRQKYYDMILNGEKTIESRFSMNKIAPYNKVKIGDEILLKSTGQPVTATAIVKSVEFYELTPDVVEGIRIKYGKQIGTDRIEDWQTTYQKKYCTLIWLEKVRKISPQNVKRSNGAAWIILNDEKQGE